MKRPFIFSLLILFILILSVQIGFARPQPIRFADGQAVIVLKDDLKHPFFYWPTTLLQYQVAFEKGVDAASLTLTQKETGKNVPFQLSGPQATAGGRQLYTLSLLSDLPSGGHKTFVLENGKATRDFPEVSTQKEGNTILIRTNKLSIRIPASQTIQGTAPGPVMQVFPAGGQAMGESVFNPGKRKLQRIETEQIASGPVFAGYKISYFFQDGASYVATVKGIQDYEFVDLKEEMSGMVKGENVSWQMHWTGFAPTHRQATNHPYGAAGNKPGFGRYEWETIDQKMLSSQHGIIPDPKEEGRLPFGVSLFQTWNPYTLLTSSVFWDEKKNQSVGVFITDAAAWNDKDYPIWFSSGIFTISFYYRNGILSANYPVSEGTRATAISCYPHQQDIAFMNELEVKSKTPVTDPLGFSARAGMSALSYNNFLQNRYGTIALDKVKDWDFTYPEDQPLPQVIFKYSNYKDGPDLMRSFLSSGFNSDLAVGGPRGSYAPVPARIFNSTYVTSFNRFYRDLPKEQKARVAAMYLLHAYVAADEEFMPMKHMLSGHPNFLADVKTIPGLVAFQFPGHPEAKNWTNLFQKYVELNARYHTRPDVKAWDAQGGRWTENLGTYVWAFLRPTLRTAYVLKQNEPGRNTLATPGIAAVGSWALHALSAPYAGESLDFYREEGGRLPGHLWGAVTKAEGPRRVHAPQGAHSARRKPPSSLWFLGSMLERYDPLLAEHLRYVARPTDDDMETFVDEKEPFNIMFPDKNNYDKGTKPDFKSIKLTGYGTILRAGVDTPEELSLHLGQIDPGPNYRWGVAGQGGSGTIYFYAGGKSYAHNGREDAGDRRLQDTDLMTSFGVFKDGTFKSIGMNVLHRPLYNLGTGQFTEVTSADKQAYSWPEYQSRSIMLVDKDYFITYDDVYNSNITGRFSWFTHLEEELPEIQVVKTGKPRDGYKKTDVKTEEVKGVWYDVFGDCLALISHKKGFKAEPAVYGAKVTSPSGQTDYIYRNDVAVEVKEADKVFRGTAGFMRVHPNGEQELALFHGQQIGNGRFLMTSSDSDAGISAKLEKNGFTAGRFYSLKAAKVTFSGEQLAPGMHLYVDGHKQATTRTGNGFEFDFPAGQHEWQISKGQPIPVRPQVVASENDKGKVHLFFAASPGAQQYQVELSRDNGQSWKAIGKTTRPAFTVGQVASLNKAHVRVVARNKEHQSEASPAYPLYFTKDKPATPDGLKAHLTDGGAELTWGQVLGVPTYKLYRRKQGESRYQLIYSGKGNRFSDKTKAKDTIYEYAVAGVNRNGESAKSSAIDTDPESWLHWEPKPGEKFRRTHITIGVDKDQIYYPE